MTTETETPAVYRCPFYAAILANPTDDTARLAYADFLDERDVPGDAARAEFIRAMFAVRDMGPPRYKMFGLMVSRGTDYYEMVEASDLHVTVGVRVDVANSYNAKKRRGGPKMHHGLLVTRIQPDDPDLGTVRVSLKRDDQSKPYPVDRWNELMSVCDRYHDDTDRDMRDGLLVAGFTSLFAFCSIRVDHSHPFELFGYNLHPFGTHPARYNIQLRYHCGFLSRVECPWGQWAAHGDALMARYPITHVTFTQPIPVGTFRLSNPGNTPIKWSMRPLWESDGTFADKPISITWGDLNTYLRRVQRDDAVEPRPSVVAARQFILSQRWPTIPPENWGNVGP